MKASNLKLLLLGFQTLFVSTTLNAQHTSDIQKIEEFVVSTMEHNNIVGSAVSVFNLETELLTKGFGDTGLLGTGVDENTPFNIGSLTKSFTGFAIFQLEEAGKLSLDDLVVTYLPGFRTKNKTLSDQITIRHLLNHNSGFTTVQGNRMQVTLYNEPDALSKAVKDYKNISLHYKPGSYYEYSNANYQILGLLVEKLSKSSFEDYVTSHILLPLKMENTSFQANSKTAIPHRYVFGIPVKHKNDISRTIVAQGGIYASASDMQKYLEAILKHDTVLVSESSYQRIFSESQSGLEKFGYAGWRKRIVEQNNKEIEVFWHAGGNPGINASMFLIPEMNTGISVLTNTAGSYGINSTNPLCYGPANMLLGMPPPSHSSVAGIFLMVLWIIPLLLFWSIWKKIKNPKTSKSLVTLLVYSSLVVGLCFLLLKIIPNYVGGTNFMTVLRFEPEIGFLLLTISLPTFILVLIDWVKINKKPAANTAYD